APPVSPRPFVRAVADVRPGPRHRGNLPQCLWRIRTALPNPGGPSGWLEPRLHVPALLPRLGRPGLRGGLLRHVVADREDPHRRLPARGGGKPGTGARVRSQRAAAHDLDLRVRRGTGRLCRRAGRSDLPGESVDGAEPDHHRVRHRSYRRPGFGTGLDRHRPRHRYHRRTHQDVLSRGLDHRGVRHHGDRVAAPPPRTVRKAAHMSITAGKLAALGLVATFLLVAPFLGVYPIFLMKLLCFALFATAFNLVLGYVGLLSFGHAAFFGMAAYFTGHMVKQWAFPTEIGILMGALGAGALGFVVA